MSSSAIGPRRCERSAAPPSAAGRCARQDTEVCRPRGVGRHRDRAAPLAWIDSRLPRDRARPRRSRCGERSAALRAARPASAPHGLTNPGRAVVHGSAPPSVDGLLLSKETDHDSHPCRAVDCNAVGRLHRAAAGLRAPGWSRPSAPRRLGRSPSLRRPSSRLGRSRQALAPPVAVRPALRQRPGSPAGAGGCTGFSRGDSARRAAGCRLRSIPSVATSRRAARRTHPPRHG